MNILMVLENEFPPDVRVEKEIRILNQAGHRIYLVSVSKNIKKPELEKSDNLTIHRVYMSKLMHKLSAVALVIPAYFRFWKKNLESIIKNNKFDIIHLHDLPLASVVFKIGMSNNIPVIFDFHENRPEIMKLYAHTKTVPGRLLISQKKWENYQRKFSPLANRLILVTPEAKKYYQDKYNVKYETTYVVPNYADIAYLKSIIPINSIVRKYKEKFMLVYFGDTGIRRGTKTIIEAANILKKKSDFHFVIIGISKEQSELLKLIRFYGLSNVELTGFLDFQHIVSYIIASKAGLCTFLRNDHHDTTYANKLFQYMYFGKPVIVSDCPAQVNIVNDSNSGIIYNAGNANDLAKKIIYLKEQSDYKSLSENASVSVMNKYNTKKGFKSLHDLYESFEN